MTLELLRLSHPTHCINDSVRVDRLTKCINKAVTDKILTYGHVERKILDEMLPYMLLAGNTRVQETMGLAQLLLAHSQDASTVVDATLPHKANDGEGDALDFRQ